MFQCNTMFLCILDVQWAQMNIKVNFVQMVEQKPNSHSQEDLTLDLSDEKRGQRGRFKALS